MSLESTSDLEGFGLMQSDSDLEGYGLMQSDDTTIESDATIIVNRLILIHMIGPNPSQRSFWFQIQTAWISRSQTLSSAETQARAASRSTGLESRYPPECTTPPARTTKKDRGYIGKGMESGSCRKGQQIRQHTVPETLANCARKTIVSSRGQKIVDTQVDGGVW